MLPQLNPKLAAFFGSLLTFCGITGAAPLNYDKTFHTIEMSKRRVHKFWFHFNIFMCILKCLYLLCLLGNRTQKKSALDGSLMMFWLTMYALQSVLQICIGVNPTEVAKCMNEFFKLAITLSPYVLVEHQERYERRRRRINKLLQYFVIGYIYIAISCAVGSIAFYASWNDHPSYLFSLIPPPYCHNRILIVLFILYEASQYAVLWTLFLMSAFFMVFYAVIVTSWLQQLRWCVPRANDHTIYFSFQKLSVLNCLLTDALDPIAFIGHKVVLIPLTVIASFAALYQYEWIQSAPTIYAAIVASMTGCMYFQSVWYQMCMSLNNAAVPLHRRYIGFNWSKGRPYSWKKLCRRLPGHFSGPFNVWLQMKPHAFFHTIFMYTMKIHFYVRK